MTGQLKTGQLKSGQLKSSYQLKTKPSEYTAVEDLDSLVLNLAVLTLYFDYMENGIPHHFEWGTC